jgi:hypothetical protein
VEVRITLDEGRSTTAKVDVHSRLHEAGLVDVVDLVALVRVPPGHAYVRGQARVVVDDGLDDCAGRLDGRKVSQLDRLSVHIIPQVSANGTRVGGRARPLGVDAIVDGFQLV